MSDLTDLLEARSRIRELVAEIAAERAARYELAGLARVAPEWLHRIHVHERARCQAALLSVAGRATDAAAAVASGSEPNELGAVQGLAALADAACGRLAMVARLVRDWESTS